MKPFSLSWKSSSKVSKQRKFRLNAPLHIKRRFLTAAVSAELKARYGAKAIPVREGDTVKLIKGEFRGVTGKINAVNLKKGTVYIDGVERVRKDGTKSYMPVMPSSLMISEASFEDRRRAASMSRKGGAARKTEAASSKPATKAVKK